MKTKPELRSIINQWWAYNSEMAQLPEGRYFMEQIGDWQSGFRNHTKAEYQPDTEIECLKVGDVKEGLSIHLKSGPYEIKGILTKSGEWIERIESEGTGSMVFQTAGIDG